MSSKTNMVLNAVGTIAVAATVIPGLPVWAVTLIAAAGGAALKLSNTPIKPADKKE